MSILLIAALGVGACASGDADATDSESLAFTDREVIGDAGNEDEAGRQSGQDPIVSSTAGANGLSTRSTTPASAPLVPTTLASPNSPPPTSPPTALTPTTAPSTMSPTTGSTPTTLGVSASDIDCVTGRFSVSPADPALNKIVSIDLTRNGAVIETIQPSPDGNHQLAVTDSDETVAAILNIDNGGTTSTVAVTTGDCSGVFGGNYQVCNGEAILVAYPHSWYSQTELTGDPFCSFFRSGPEDGHSDHDITLVSFPASTTASLTPSLLTSTTGVVVLADDALTPVGPYLNRPVRRIDLAHPSDPGVLWRRYYLFDASGFATGLQVEVGASAANDATVVLDAMITTLSVFEH